MPPYFHKIYKMSLNRYEQAVFTYWEKQPDELRHWQARVATVSQQAIGPGELARGLERELWEYFIERSQHVTWFRDMAAGENKRISLLNLADHVLRLWGVTTKSTKLPKQG
jgi:hypothetical protein